MNLYFNTDKSVFMSDPTLENIVWKWVNPSTKTAKTAMSTTGEPIPLSYGTRHTPEVTVDTLTLGDGYEQVTEAGIRPVRKKITVVFKAREVQVIRALIRFFEGDPGTLYDRRPSEWFWFKLPYPYDDANARPRKWRCISFNSEPETYNANTMTCEFVESFEP
jgi:phage-related protein